MIRYEGFSQEAFAHNVRVPGRPYSQMKTASNRIPFTTTSISLGLHEKPILFKTRASPSAPYGRASKPSRLPSSHVPSLPLFALNSCLYNRQNSALISNGKRNQASN